MFGISPQRLFDILDDNGFFPRAYSGRGMYGTRCVGFVPEQHDEGIGTHSLVAVAMIMASIEDGEEREELVFVFQDAKTDSMGRDTIIYFPRMAWDAEYMDARVLEQDE